MATLTNAFRINGVVDTSRSVLENLNELCSASGCWMTYDITTGLWSVIINRAGSSTKSFDDSNILGSINVSGTGITEAYNKASIEFPHKDLRDQTDYIDLSIPLEDRYPNEIDNTLSITTDLVNDPVQAQYLANVELKQSRVDRIVEFRTDYSSLGLRAGDLIDITAEMYGWTNKIFRVISISEADTDDGIIELSVTALEYDADVYDDTGLVRETRSKKTGIVPKAANTSITASEATAAGAGAINSLLDPGNIALLWQMVSALGQRNMPTYDSFVLPFAGAYLKSTYEDWISNGCPDQLVSGLTDFVAPNPIVLTPDAIPAGMEVSGWSLSYHFSMPYGNITYGSVTTAGYWPFYVYIYYNTVNDLGSATPLEVQRTSIQTSDISFHLRNAPYGYYWFVFAPCAAYASDYSYLTPSSVGTPIDRYAGGALTYSGYVFNVYGPS